MWKRLKRLGSYREVTLPVSAFGVALFGLCVVVGLKRYPPANSAEMASWLQAVGSLVAILGAFVLGQSQANQTLRTSQLLPRNADILEQDRYRQVVALVCAEAQRVNTAAQSMSNADLKFLWEGEFQSGLDYVLQAFDAIPMHRFAVPSRIVHAFNVRQSVKRIQGYGERFLGDADNSNSDTFRDLVSGAATTLAEHMKNLDKTYPEQTR